jgi:hypothetical protein
MADIREILQASPQGKYEGFSYRVAETPYHWILAQGGDDGPFIQLKTHS